MTLLDTLRRDAWLARFSWAVQDHPDARRLTREVRRELAATAAEVGTRRALADLGGPAALAQGYLGELERPAPRWTTGSVWAGIALAFALYTGMAYGFGTLDALADVAGPDGLEVQRGVLGATFRYRADSDGLTATGELSAGWLLLHAAVVAVPFVLGSRIWRWRPRGRRTALAEA